MIIKKKIEERGMMEDGWIKRVIQFLISYAYRDYIEESKYPFAIKWIANSKKIICFNVF